eukprot:31426-Pelagococcus_subviridis.AAC.12
MGEKLLYRTHLIDESLQSQSNRASQAHDRHLRAAVHEHLQRVSVHLHVHVQHDHRPERLRRRLHRRLEVLVHVFLSNRLFDLPLRVQIERVRVQEVDLRLSRVLRALPRRRRVAQHLLHGARVVVQDGAMERRVVRAERLHRVRVRADRALERRGVDRAAVGAHRRRVIVRAIRGGANAPASSSALPQEHQEVALADVLRGEDVVVRELAAVE